VHSLLPIAHWSFNNLTAVTDTSTYDEVDQIRLNISEGACGGEYQTSMSSYLSRSVYFYKDDDGFLQTAGNFTTLSTSASGITIAAWIYLDSASTIRPFVSNFIYVNSEYKGVFFGCHSNNYIYVLIGYGTSYNSLYTSTYCSATYTGQWMFVAMTYDTTSKTVKIYVNDALVKSSTYGTSAGILESSATVTIGAGFFTSATTKSYFSGYIDEVSLFDHVLSYCEVIGLYNSGFGTVLPATNMLSKYYSSALGPESANYQRFVSKLGPKAYWDFNNLTQDYIPDKGLGFFSANLTDGVCVGYSAQSEALGYAGRIIEETDGYLAAPLSKQYFSGIQMSFSIWLKITDDSGTLRAIFSNFDRTTYTGCSFYCNIYNKFIFLVGYGSSWNVLESSSASCILDTWIHIALSFNSLEGTQKMYLNGELDTSQSNTYLNKPFADGTAFKFGGGPTYTTVDYYLDGYIDDLMIFDRELSPCSIYQLYQRGSNNSAFEVANKNFSSLLEYISVGLNASGYWTFNENQISEEFIFDVVQGFKGNTSGSVLLGIEPSGLGLSEAASFSRAGSGEILVDTKGALNSPQLSISVWAKVQGNSGTSRPLLSTRNIIMDSRHN